MRRSRRISYLTQSYETNSGQEKGVRGMRSTRWRIRTLIDWKSPLDGRLRPRMATPTFKFTGMDERNTPKTEQLRYKNRGDSLTNLMNQSDLSGLKLHYRGKVGDMYDLGEHLLLVATDRISGFDVVNAALIPQKGAIRTQLSRFWFERTEHIAPNHLVTTDLAEMADGVRALRRPARRSRRCWCTRPNASISSV